MRGGAIGAILWFEIALSSGLLAAAPAAFFGAALACPSGAGCRPVSVLGVMVGATVGVGSAFLLAVVALDRAAGRWRPIAVAELLTGVAMVSASFAAAVWSVMEEDAVLVLVVFVGLLFVPGIGLADAGRASLRRQP